MTGEPGKDGKENPPEIGRGGLLPNPGVEAGKAGTESVKTGHV